MEDGKQETDASGNIRKKDFCSFLCDEIKDHFKSQKLPLTLKFIDPSYQARLQTL